MDTFLIAIQIKFQTSSKYLLLYRSINLLEVILLLQSNVDKVSISINIFQKVFQNCSLHKNNFIKVLKSWTFVTNRLFKVFNEFFFYENLEKNY